MCVWDFSPFSTATFHRSKKSFSEEDGRRVTGLHECFQEKRKRQLARNGRLVFGGGERVGYVEAKAQASLIQRLLQNYFHSVLGWKAPWAKSLRPNRPGRKGLNLEECIGTGQPLWSDG